MQPIHLLSLLDHMARCWIDDIAKNPPAVITNHWSHRESEGRKDGEGEGWFYGLKLEERTSITNLSPLVPAVCKNCQNERRRLLLEILAHTLASLPTGLNGPTSEHGGVVRPIVWVWMRALSILHSFKWVGRTVGWRADGLHPPISRECTVLMVRYSSE